MLWPSTGIMLVYYIPRKQLFFEIVIGGLNQSYICWNNNKTERRQPATSTDHERLQYFECEFSLFQAVHLH